MSEPQDNDGAIWIAVGNHLSEENQAALRRRVLGVVEAGSRTVVLDFGATTFFDSTGLGMLVSLHKALRNAHVDVRLANLRGDLAEIVRLSKLDLSFPIVDDRGGASGGA